MKKTALCLISLILFIMGCASGSKLAGSSGEKSLDQALKEAAERIDGRIPAGTKIALLNFDSPSDLFSIYVIDELTANFLDTGSLTIIARKEIDLIRSELNFQFSGEVSDDSMQAVGRMLGAQSIVSGSLQNIGSSYRIVVRVLNVQTATVEAQYRTDIANDSRVQALLAGGRSSSGGSVAASNRPANTPAQTAATETPSQPVSTVYKVGDSGPAGGIVFYDKGNSNGGWRYLEVAPANTDREPAKIEYFSGASNSFGIIRDRRLGAGKENTIMLMDIIEKRGGGINSGAWICNNLEVNGFSDWYLPSIDELIMLYTNTYAKNGSGGFRTIQYVSSTCNPDGTGIGLDFSNGREGTYDSIQRVRAVRRF
jgi:TolB-like protein